MPRTTLRAALALLLVLVACGRRETAAPPALPPDQPTPVAPGPQQAAAATPTASPAPPVTWQPAELTAMAAEGALQQTAQAISQLLTASPAGAEGYTAVALYETARATMLPGAALEPDAAATAVSTEQAGSLATAARAIDYTATALATEQAGSTAATATWAAELGQPAAVTATPTLVPGALRYYLPAAMAQRFSVYALAADVDGYSVDFAARDTAQGQPPTVALLAGVRAERAWPQPRPGMPDPEQVTPVRVHDAEGFSAIVDGALSLAWQEDGQSYLLTSASYSLPELLALAQSLEAYDQGAWEAQARNAQQ